MSESLSLRAEDGPSPLTPRQNRFEERLARAISNGAPRSETREAVHQLVDHLRLLGVPPARGLCLVMETASRGVRGALASTTWHADSLTGGYGPVDHIDLVSRWASARYGRDD